MFEKIRIRNLIILPNLDSNIPILHYSNGSPCSLRLRGVNLGLKCPKRAFYNDTGWNGLTAFFSMSRS